MTFGQQTDAARGLLSYLLVDEEVFLQQVSEGVPAIEREVLANGTEVDRECFDYVRHQEAGSSPTTFGNSPYPRDCDRDGLRADRMASSGRGMRLADFVAHQSAVAAKLSDAHVLALRLYSTAAFRSINGPLRDTSRDRPPHPLPVTCHFLMQALSRLRAVGNEAGSTPRTIDLFRGVSGRALLDEFHRKGGTELSPMSTTTDLSVAVQYSKPTAQGTSLIFKIKTTNFMDRGGDIQFLSAFPAEREFLYPPLTFLQPTGVADEVTVSGLKFTVIEVEARLGGS